MVFSCSSYFVLKTTMAKWAAFSALLLLTTFSASLAGTIVLKVPQDCDDTTSPCSTITVNDDTGSQIITLTIKETAPSFLSLGFAADAKVESGVTLDCTLKDTGVTATVGSITTKTHAFGSDTAKTIVTTSTDSCTFEIQDKLEVEAFLVENDKTYSYILDGGKLDGSDVPLTADTAVITKETLKVKITPKSGAPKDCTIASPSNCVATLYVEDSENSQIFKLAAPPSASINPTFLSLGFSTDGKPEKAAVVACVINDQNKVEVKLSSYDDKGAFTEISDASNVVLDDSKFIEANNWFCSFKIQKEITVKDYQIQNKKEYKLVIDAGDYDAKNGVITSKTTPAGGSTITTQISGTSTTTTEKDDSGSGSAIKATIITVFLAVFAYLI